MQEYVVNGLSIEIYVAEENVKIVVFAFSLMQSQGNVSLSTNAKTYINRFKLPYFYCFRRKGESQKNKYDLILMPLHLESSSNKYTTRLSKNDVRNAEKCKSFTEIKMKQAYNIISFEEKA